MSPVECHRKYLKSSLLFSVERGHRKNYASTIRQGQGTMISIRRYDTRVPIGFFVNKNRRLRTCVNDLSIIGASILIVQTVF